MDEIRIEGHCDERFAKVRDAFEQSFARGEVGAGVSVVRDGEQVIDLWGGFADAAKTRPWERDTIVNVYSTTKGMTAICAHRLVDEGRLDLDLPVAKYWPEFAEEGKQDVPVRMLLSHRTGLCVVDPPLAPEYRYDWDRITAALAAQKPFWEPGTKHGYHAMTFGHLVGEVVRRIDGRSLGTYFRDEVALPLEADFHIGLAEEHDRRCAEMIPAPRDPDAPDFLEMMRKNPGSLAAKVFGGSSLDSGAVNSRAWRAAEITPQYNRAGVRRFAYVFAADADLPPSSEAAPEAYEGEDFATRFFHAEDAATAWVADT